MTFRRTSLVSALLVVFLVSITPASAQISEEQFQVLLQRLNALEKRMDQIENEISASTRAPLVSPTITSDVAAQIETLDQAIRIADRKRELDQEALTEREAAAPVAAAGPGGFSLQSSNGDYRLILGLVAQADGRFTVDKPNPIINTFTLRKIRPTFTGRLARYFDYKVMPDFGGGTTIIQDAYFDIRFSPKFRIRTGKDKTPIGYEVLIGDTFLLFPERSLASNLLPNRDIGLQAQGDLLGNKLFYDAGVFNGIPDGTSLSSEIDTNDSKDFAGRFVLQPFRSASNPTGRLNGLGLQIGGSSGRQSGTLPTFKTSVGQTFFSYAAGSVASGDRRRVSPALFYYYKAFGGFAEYMRSTQSVSRPGIATDVRNQGWDVAGSFLLTGEAAGERGVQPKFNFDPLAGRWGALQLVGRYTFLNVDRNVFSLGLASPSASRLTKSFTVGANWYPNSFIKIYGTYERTLFEGLTSRPSENVILVRSQLAF
jgi:phosphate-selective porin OprO and OprP